jgi:hypothetical protein
MKRWSIVDFYRHLKSLEDSFLVLIEENYFYYELWRQVLEDFRERLCHSTNLHIMGLPRD